MVEHPNAIYEAYDFLKTYFEHDRSTTGFQEDLLRVPVPVSNCSNPLWVEWRSAGEVYFSAYWTSSADLETVYADCDDVYFLGSIKALRHCEDSEAKKGWYQFFTWLGVSDRPRLIQKRWVRIGGDDGYSWAVKHPFEGCLEWDRYLKQFEKDFHCKNTNPKSSWHGRTRQMQENWCIEHFDHLVRQADVTKLGRLFELLGRHWETYQKYLTVELNCQYISTGCLKGNIPLILDTAYKNFHGSQWNAVTVNEDPSSG
jgi:hypothetical protein